MEWGWTGFNNNAIEFLNNTAVMEAFVDVLVCAVPIWLAVMIGLLIGWSWWPRWTGLVFLGLRSKLRFIWTIPPGLGARRFWLAFTALSAFSLCRGLWFRSRGASRKMEKSSSQESVENFATHAASAALDSVDDASCYDVNRPPTGTSEGESNVVTEKDLEHLLKLINAKDAEMAWQNMMERSTSNMTYQAWCHEPVMGPTVYRSKTIFEDATPELVRDFFWDDEYRPKWDPMLVHVNILEECPDTGMMIIHWIKKFPFFCSDREYIISRRIWEHGNTFYCLTKGVPYTTLPRQEKPRRVDLYFSSWVIKAVQSRNGQSSACEVALVHHEDMGIPKDVAKLGVRHGMWGTVKKLNAGFRAYQNARIQESSSLSRCAVMARTTTKISCGEGIETNKEREPDGEERELRDVERQKGGGVDWRWVAVGGAVAIVCGLQTGVIGGTLLIGAGRRIAGRRGNGRR